jgi:methyltransferase FkbM-like protein
MDVEGAEPQVLRGAARLLEEDRPLILSELHPTQLERASGITADEFLAQIAEHGYRAHRIENGAIGAPIDRAPADALVSMVLAPQK